MFYTLIICLLIAYVISFICNVLLIRKIKSLISPFNTPQNKEVHEELTSYELERLEREQEFDERINRLKDELAQKQEHMERFGTTADELHPLVKNLPHNNIPSNTDPDIEYAD